jgi:hypothetical protein
VHDAAVGEVVRDAVVLRDAVVPEGEVVGLPFPAHRELGLGGVREQEGEEGVALGGLQVHDAREVRLAEEERLAVALRVRAHERVDDGGVGAHRDLPERLLVAAALVVVARLRERLEEVVLRAQAGEEALQRGRERLERRAAAREERVAAERGDGLGGEDGAHGRRLDEGHVRVPPRIVRRVVAVVVQQHDLLELPGPQVRVNRMHVQLPEAPGERALLLRRHLLVAEEEHLVPQQRVVDRLSLLPLQRLRHRYPLHLRPYRRRQRRDLQTHGSTDAEITEIPKFQLSDQAPAHDVQELN